MRVFLMTPVEDMTTNPNHWAHRLPGGVVGETGPHAVYLSLALLGKVSDVTICMKKLLPEYPWSVVEDVRFDLAGENGISSVALMYGSNQAAAEIEIIGTEGMLKVDLESRILVDHRRTVGKELLTATAVTRSVLASIYQTGLGLLGNGIRHTCSRALDGHYIGINRFLDHVKKGADYRATGEKAMETAEVLGLVIRKLQELQASPARSSGSARATADRAGA
jgi:predicted dehydrogenase